MSVKVETLRERNESGSSDLDLLFNQTDGILMDDCDTFISFNNEADAMVRFCKQIIQLSPKSGGILNPYFNPHFEIFN